MEQIQDSTPTPSIWDFAEERMNKRDLQNRAYSVATSEAEPRLRRAAARLTDGAMHEGMVDMQTIPGAHDVRLDMFVNLWLADNVLIRSRVSVSSLPSVEPLVENPWLVATCRNCGYPHETASVTPSGLVWLRVALDSCSCGCGVAVAA